MRWLLIAVAVVWGSSVAIVVIAMVGRLVSKRIRRMIDGE
jgi:hypothetical protein